MRRNKRTLIAAIGAGALVLAGSAAFTNTNTGLSGNVTGYGGVSATGADVLSVTYTLDGNDPPSVTVVTVVTSGDTHLSSTGIGFNGTGTLDTVAGSCSGTYNGSTHTTYACTLTTPELVSAITSTDIVVAPGA